VEEECEEDFWKKQEERVRRLQRKTIITTAT